MILVKGHWEAWRTSRLPPAGWVLALLRVGLSEVFGCREDVTILAIAGWLGCSRVILENKSLLAWCAFWSSGYWFGRLLSTAGLGPSLVQRAPYLAGTA